MNELALLENVNAVEVFTGDGLDDLLKKITDEAKSIVPNIETARGRKEIAGLAAKVAKSKVHLDGLGKDLVSDWKQKAKVVDIERKKMRDYLDDLKEEVRKPLSDWEDAEDERVLKHKNNILEMMQAGIDTAEKWMELPVEIMQDQLKEIEETKIDESWQEFANDAAKTKDQAITIIKGCIEKRQKYDADQAELEKHRKESAEREQKEREENLRKEGEEKAKREAEEKAKEEAKRAEREKQAAIQAKENAERRVKEAEDNATRKAEDAAKAERDRIESERVAEELAAKKREADKKHRAKINNAAVDALKSAGLGELSAKKAVTAIAKGQVPHVTISY